MTDLEINKALALAIGWHKNKVHVKTYSGLKRIEIDRDYSWGTQRFPFHYKNWNVIGPIAERFDCFPNKAQSTKHIGEWYAPVGEIANGVYANTPQKAIALAVIGSVK